MEKYYKEGDPDGFFSMIKVYENGESIELRYYGDSGYIAKYYNLRKDGYFLHYEKYIEASKEEFDIMYNKIMAMINEVPK